MGKIMILIFIATAVVGSIVWLERPTETSVCTGNEAVHDIYSFSYLNSRGTCTKLSSFKAPVVVINAWASWCPFCVKELPDLAKLAEEYPAVPVVAINRGEKSATAKTFLKTIHTTKKLHTLFDPEDSFYAFIEGVGMPETVFIDDKGAVLFHKRGAMSLEEMRNILNLLLKQVQPSASTHNNQVCLGEGNVCTIN